MTVWYKQGVLGDLQPVVRKALGKVASLIESNGHDTFITSLRDGNHSSGSLHYDGLAFDLKHYSVTTIANIKLALGSDFDVIDESNHIHIEYDPKEK